MLSRMIGLAIAVSLSCAALAQPGEFVIVPWGVGNPPTPGSGSIGMFSIEDGSYLGDLVPPDPDRIVFPNTAIIGPDRLVYISDSVNDTITRYDLRGRYVDTFLGPDDGLDNVRGMCFVGDELLFANNPIAGSGVDRTQVSVQRVNLDGEFLDPLLAPGSMVSAWDVFMTPAGELLIADVNGFTARPVTRYDTSGAALGSPISIPFATQITGAHTQGEFYVFQFSGRVSVFDNDGLIRRFNMAGLGNAGQGLFALRDGNLLAASFNAGVYVHSTTGARLASVREGFGLYGLIKPASVCWADLDNDLDTDFDDVVRFLHSFASGLGEADIAPPLEQHDIADVLAFLDRFDQGCP